MTTELGQPALDVDRPDADDLQLYSVTTIIGVMDKPALKYWSAELTANAAIDNLSTWQAMLEDRGRPETVTWLRDAMNRRPKYLLKNEDLGTVAHLVCQEYGLTGTKPGPDFIADKIRHYGTAVTDVDAETRTVAAMLNQFDEWLQIFTPKMLATEVAVYSPTYGYAGQLDAIMDIDGVTFCTDYKSSRESYDKKGVLRGPYPDQVGLQIAAYRYAEFAAVWRPRRYEKQFRRYYMLSETEQAMAIPVPEVHHGLVIQLCPEHCHAYPIRADEEAHRAFLYALELFRWKEETSKTVMGDALTR